MTEPFSSSFPPHYPAFPPCPPVPPTVGGPGFPSPQGPRRRVIIVLILVWIAVAGLALAGVEPAVITALISLGGMVAATLAMRPGRPRRRLA